MINGFCVVCLMDYSYWRIPASCSGGRRFSRSNWGFSPSSNACGRSSSRGFSKTWCGGREFV